MSAVGFHISILVSFLVKKLAIVTIILIKEVWISNADPIEFRSIFELFGQFFLQILINIYISTLFNPSIDSSGKQPYITEKRRIIGWNIQAMVSSHGQSTDSPMSFIIDCPIMFFHIRHDIGECFFYAPVHTYRIWERGLVHWIRVLSRSSFLSSIPIGHDYNHRFYFTLGNQVI